MDWLRIINHWVHLTSVVTFIGGLAFIVMVMKPALKSFPLSETAGPFLLNISRRFRTLAGSLMVIIIFTGATNAYFRSQEMGSLPRGYVTVLALKLLIAVAIFTIYLYLIIMAMTRRNPPERDIASGRLSDLLDLPFHRVAFLLALIVIFLAATLRTWH